MFNKLNKARNHATDYVTLRNMAPSRSWKIREALAGNRNLQIHVLEELVSDKVEAVRVAIAGNPNVNAKIWDALSEDTSPKVREALLETHAERPGRIGHRG